MGVKTAKRILRGVLDARGNLNDPKVVAALLEHRNTRDRDLKRSPAEMVAGRTLQGILPEKASNLRQNPEALLTGEERVKLLSKRQAKRAEELSQGTRALSQLKAGTLVQIQNGTDRHWDRTGTIIGRADDAGHSYQVRVDGAPRPSLRNRVSLRPLKPGKTTKDPEDIKKKSKGKENIPPEQVLRRAMGDECSKEPPKDKRPKEKKTSRQNKCSEERWETSAARNPPRTRA